MASNLCNAIVCACVSVCVRVCGHKQCAKWRREVTPKKQKPVTVPVSPPHLATHKLQQCNTRARVVFIS